MSGKDFLSGSLELELEEDLQGEDDSLNDELMIEDIEAPSVILIPKKKMLSNSDIVRRASEPRILLDQADLRLAHRVEYEADMDIGVKHELSFSSLHKEDKEKVESSYKGRDSFILNDGIGLTSELAQLLLLEHGKNLLPEKKKAKWLIFIQQLYQPMPLMIWAAVIILAAIELFVDMGILLFIQFANAGIGYYETTKAGDAVDALKNSLQPSATVKRDGEWQQISTCSIVPGDLVLLSGGMVVPADCHIHNGAGVEVDQSSLTGESLPVMLYRREMAKMGSSIVRGETEATVEFTGVNTYLGKTASLLKKKTEISNIQRFLVRIVLILTSIALVVVVVSLLYLLLQEKVIIRDALAFCTVLLVASIPLAIEIVTTTTLALGSQAMVTEGAICTRLSAIEDLASMAILCSDKTGTLTTNRMQLQEEAPIYERHQSRQSLLQMAAMASRFQEPPKDALDRLILEQADLELLESMTQLAFLPFDPVVKRTEGTVKSHDTGRVSRITKGAPHVLLALCERAAQVPLSNVRGLRGKRGTRGTRGISDRRLSKGGSISPPPSIPSHDSPEVLASHPHSEFLQAHMLQQSQMHSLHSNIAPPQVLNLRDRQDRQDRHSSSVSSASSVSQSSLDSLDSLESDSSLESQSEGYEGSSEDEGWSSPEAESRSTRQGDHAGNNSNNADNISIGNSGSGSAYDDSGSGDVNGDGANLRVSSDSWEEEEGRPHGGPIHPGGDITRSSVRRGLLRDFNMDNNMDFDTRRQTGKHVLTVARQVERDVRDLGRKGVRSLAVAASDLLSPHEYRFRKESMEIEDVMVMEEKEEMDDSPGAKGALPTAVEGHWSDWRMLGLLTFLDPPREDTKQTLADAQALGVTVKMVTGDHVLIAKEMARKLGLGHSRIFRSQTLPVLDATSKEKPADLCEKYGDLCLGADGFAEVFPEHKYLIVECLREMGYKVGMTGDGVNDAPALKTADVGIAVEGSTDAAKAAAAIVLTKPGLSTIVHSILISRKIFARIRNFVFYRIAATLQLLFFFFIALFLFQPSDYEPLQPVSEDSRPWPSYFSLPVLLLMFITVLNDGTMVTIAYDSATPSPHPERWNLPVLFTIGGVLAAVPCLSSLLLLYLLLDSWNPIGLFQITGLGGLSYGQITASIFLKVAVSDFLTLYSARTGELWFWQSFPVGPLFIASVVALLVSTVLACAFPLSYPDGIMVLGLARRPPLVLPVLVWMYCLIWFVIQDACKVLAFWLLKRGNWFGINNWGGVEIPESAKKLMREMEHKDKDLGSRDRGRQRGRGRRKASRLVVS